MSKIILIALALGLSGCVVMSKQSFQATQQEAHQLGYMDGTDDCHGWYDPLRMAQ